MAKKQIIFLFLWLAFIFTGLHDLVPHHHHYDNTGLEVNQQGKKHDDEDYGLNEVLSRLYHSGESFVFLHEVSHSPCRSIYENHDVICLPVAFIIHLWEAPLFNYALVKRSFLCNSYCFSPLGLRAPPAHIS